MQQPVSIPVSLTHLPIGAAGRVTHIGGGRELHRKLRALGVRVGTEVRVEHRRGRGLVVSAGSTRIALGGGVVEKLLVQPFADDTGST